MSGFAEFDGEDDDEEVEYYAVRPNKTQIKKDIAALFTLGETMAKLSPAHLVSLELPENIHKAIAEVSAMPPTGARKRSLKYIAGQLHKIDVAPIKEKLARIQNQSIHTAREHHIVEHWRDRLILEGNDALAEFFDEQPAADLQHIRQLLRNIKKETDGNNPPKSARLLYRYIKSLTQAESKSETENEKNNGVMR